MLSNYLRKREGGVENLLTHQMKEIQGAKNANNNNNNSNNNSSPDPCGSVGKSIVS